MFRPLGLFVLLAAILLLSVVLLWQPTQTVRGKPVAAPLAQTATQAQQAAQTAALADPRVIQHTVGRRAEVFGVRDVMGQFTPDSSACATAVCYQVEIYNFDDNTAVLAIVRADTNEVLDVLHQPGVQPGINKRLADRAVQIATNAPQVIEALGYRPQAVAVAPVPAGMPGTICDEGHLCAAPTFNLGDRFLWAVVDLTDERLVDIAWTEMIPDTPNTSMPAIPQGCPAPGTVNRDGWELAYETTGTDGLRVHTIRYNGELVANNIKLVEWHAAYTSTGFVDSTGCGGGGGGFPIYPYGETEIHDLLDGQSNVIGFEVVQDFRMSNWGSGCNYRYDQHIQFFSDGRFRVVSGAYGKGCGTNATYRPVVRVDIAVNGSANDSFATWNGSEWQTENIEFWQLQDVPYTVEGYKWQVSDVSGAGYSLEPGQGQFGDGGLGDNGFIYVTQHKPAEGDTDLGVIGSCCNSNYQQGPHNYINGESIVAENIVIWYAPQMVTNATPGSYYCWTVSGEPNPETYPCYSGPMFVPLAVGDPTYGVTLAPAAANQTGAPGSTVTYTLSITNSGTISDSFGFTAAGANWAVGLPPTVTLAAGAAAAVPLTVAVPDGAVGGDADVMVVTATSVGDAAVSAASTLTTTAETNYGVILTPTAADGFGASGSMVTYTLSITNTGNVSDTFAITLGGSAWGAAAPGIVALGEGESAQFVVGVAVPLTAVHGQSDSVTITATSAGDALATAVSVLTTTAVNGDYSIYLPVILKP
ncbi:MAG: hypothetical protein IPM39_03495 [Chloroflexi bacterium]|nr:hypothetical protein [Chloroflexota bacterium]